MIQVEPEHTHNSNALHNLAEPLIGCRPIHLSNPTQLLSSFCMRTLRYLLLSSLVGLLAGCVTVNIQSNVKRDAVPDFRRILIVSKLSTLDPAYLPEFQTAFPPTYQVCSVADSPIAFESSEELIKEQQEVCGSEVLLTLGFSRNYTRGGGEYISSYNEVYVEMSSFSSGKPFWKAIITTEGGNEIPPRKIVNQLIEDGIIADKLPDNQ